MIELQVFIVCPGRKRSSESVWFQGISETFELFTFLYKDSLCRMGYFNVRGNCYIMYGSYQFWKLKLYLFGLERWLSIKKHWCFSRGPDSNSQHPCHGWQLSVCNSSTRGSMGTSIHMTHKHTYMQNTHTHKIKLLKGEIFFKNILFILRTP